MFDHPTTGYFRHVRLRPDRVIIQDEWIARVIEDPDREEIQQDGRIRRWKRIVEAGGRALRVVLLLSEDLYIDLDAEGRVVSITVEHASRQGDPRECSFERIAAGSGT